ncbi:unnamed protein product [Knipowitschia caucasica]|uniref:UDENN FLCN/SMCR8-type domain-containing protein n=2 Tax=Knipowitschia caucasica TaxID=637954 RepID=A0AAV2LKY1_KNICA
MIGSPDLLAFSGAEGFSMEATSEEELEAASLPEELSVPLFSPENPWSNSSRFNRDFILVAEFSEQVGPSPVLTIPDDPRVMGSFDLNHFSVRIMSVDYQASGPAPAPPSCPGPRLNFSEDSRVVLGDSAEDAYAYVHHVTLFDLEARGMVRPFCMAYVCSEQSKLMENFCELSASFSRASDSLKTGNRQAFSAELQRKLQELEFKRLSLKQETLLPPVQQGPIGEPSDLEVLELSIHTHRELLRQVTSYPNRKLRQPDFLPYDPAESLPDSSLLPLDPCREHRPQLKALPELCNSYFLGVVKEQLADTEARLRGDRSALRTNSVLGPLTKCLPLTSFLFELWPSDPLEEEEEEERGQVRANCSPEAPEADPLSLESFFSCVEEIPIKMEAERRCTSTLDRSVSMEMTGSVSSSDSIEVLTTEKSFRTQQSNSDCESKESPGLLVEPVSKRVPVDVRRGRAYARRANSEDSIEVLSTTDSILPEDLSAITEEAEPSPQSNRKLPPHPPKELPEPSEPAALRPHHTHGPEEQGTKTAMPPLELSEWPSPGSLVESLQVTSLSSMARWSQGSPPTRLLSVDERSDCTSATGSSDPPAVLLSSTQGIRRRRRRRRKAGLRALRFIKQHSYYKHVLYCLLSGRPLVVVGADEAVLRKVVDGLSLFVPAPGPEQRVVLPSLSSPLHLPDLLTWRLIGIHRSSGSASAGVVSSLSRYSRYLSVLELDQRTLKAPLYSGSLIGHLAEAQCGFSRGLTYLLHVESELSVLQNQALLYAVCPLYRQRLKLTHCDHRVLQFLSDLVAQQHAGQGPPVLTYTYSSMHLHRNTAAP